LMILYFHRKDLGHNGERVLIFTQNALKRITQNN